MPGRTVHSSPRTGEEGVALFYALLVTLVVSGIVAVVFATAVSEQRQSAFELDFEDTVHVAEAGAEVFLQRLTQDANDNSGVAGPTSGADPATWAIGEALRQSNGTDYDLPAAEMAGGESVAIRPTGDDAEFVYGVGFTPSRAAFDAGTGSVFARVVRVQVAFTPSVFTGDHALLASGNLKINGNLNVTGGNGSIHTNGGLDISGTSGKVEQGITHTGSCKGSCSGTEDMQIDGPIAPQPVPIVDITSVWGTKDAKNLAQDGEWYDHCSGVWYQRGFDDPAPCTPGREMSTPPAPWSGTTFSGNDGNSAIKGTFFFASDDVPTLDIKKPNGEITIITAGSMAIGPSADQPTLEPHYPGLLFLAEGDIRFRGNFNGATSDEPALVYSNETITFNGTPNFTNLSFVAGDELNVGSNLNGTGDVVYNGGAAPDLGLDGYPIVVRWDEVR